MRKQALVFALFAVLVGLAAGAAQAGTLTIPVKGVIDAQNGSLALNISFYGRAVGGPELFSAAASVQVANHVYFGEVQVPDTLFRNRERVFFEVARPSAPAIVLGSRAQFTNREIGQNRAVTVLGMCSMCFTCGGSFPIFNGAFTNTGTNPSERSSSCSGSVGSVNDSRPFICCQ